MAQPLRSKVLAPNQTSLGLSALWSSDDCAFFNMNPATLADALAAPYTGAASLDKGSPPDGNNNTQPTLLASPTAAMTVRTSVPTLLTTRQIMQIANYYVDVESAHDNDAVPAASRPTFAPPSADYEPLLVCLGSMFGRSLGPVMRILANAPAAISIVFTRRTRRTFYRASGHDCLGAGYCSCSSFKFAVASKGELLHCKHILALLVLRSFNPRFTSSLEFPEGLEAKLLDSEQSTPVPPAVPTGMSRHPSLTMLSPAVSAALLGSSSKGGTASAASPTPALISFVDDEGFTWSEITEQAFAAAFQSKAERAERVGAAAAAGGGAT